jgi:hypothetical protein
MRGRILTIAIAVALGAAGPAAAADPLAVGIWGSPAWSGSTRWP